MLSRCSYVLRTAVKPTSFGGYGAARSANGSQCLRAFGTSVANAKGNGTPKIMLEDEKGFGFIRHNNRPPKPRKLGVTEIRGPYYSAMGKRYLEDVLET